MGIFMSLRVRDWLILLLVCGVTIWFKLGDRDFWGRHSESRRAEVSREMVVSGDWLIPQLNGQPFITKPPLFYWAAAASFKLTGRFDEFSARLPSAVCGTLGVFVTYCWVTTLFSRRTGLLAGIITATNFLYAGMARSAETDSMLTLFTTAALGCFALGMSRPTRTTPFYLLTAAWIGLGTMAKNPIGFAVPLLAIAGYILLTRQFKLIWATKPWWGLLIFLAIVLPWFALVYQRVPNFFEVLQQETVGRYADPEGTPHLEPFYYYLPALGAFAPWVMFLPAVVVSVAKRGFRRISQNHLFVLIAAITTFLLFSSVGSKREYYLLPMYPLLAILVAIVWEEYFEMKQPTGRRWGWKTMDIPIIGFGGVLGIAGLGLPIAAYHYLPGAIAASFVFGVTFLVMGIALIVLFLKGKTNATFWGFTFATLGLYVCGLTTIVPEMDRYRSRQVFFQEAAVIAGTSPMADFDYEGFEAQFYMQRLIVYCLKSEERTTFLEQSGPAFVLLTGTGYDRIQQEQPQLAERLEVVLDRTWTSATEPHKQKRLLLLKKRT